MGVGFEPRTGHMWDNSSSACDVSGAFSWSTPIFAPPTDLLLSEIIDF